MEYPFKDLLPREEVTARQGYYRDWTHIDANTFHQISELAKFIREKGYGSDTREAIAQGLERVYHDAAMSGNANMEVSMARAGFNTLGERLNDTTAQLAQKVDKGNVSVSDINKNLGKLDQSFMSDEFLQQMVGNTPINTTPPYNSLTTPKYVDKSVTEQKTSFIKQSSNLFNIDTIIREKGVNANTGELVDNEGVHTSILINVNPNTTYSTNNRVRITYYDGDGKFISSTLLSEEGTFTTPESVFFIRLTIVKHLVSGFALNEGNVLLPYEDYYNHLDDKLIKNDSISSEKVKNSVSSNSILYGVQPVLFDFRNKTIHFKLATGLTFRNMRLSLPATTVPMLDDNFQVLFYNPKYKTFEVKATGTLTSHKVMSEDNIIVAVIDLLNHNVYALGNYKIESNRTVYAKDKTIQFSNQPIPSNFQAPSTGLSTLAGNEHSSGFHHAMGVEDLYYKYDELANAHPTYVSKKLLGKDATNTFDIFEYTFKPEIPTHQAPNYQDMPKILMTMGTHGFEKLATYMPAVFFQKLCNNWADNEVYEYFRWNIEFKIIPLVNPYGFTHPSRVNGNNVDLNRNYDHNWEAHVPANTDDPLRSTAKGDAPFSEAESQYVRDFLIANQDAIYYVDWHNHAGYRDSYDKLAWQVATHQDTVDLSKDTLGQVTRNFKKRYPTLVPETVNYMGFTNQSIYGTSANYAYNVQGILSTTTEFFEETPTHTARLQPVNQLNYEWMVNWLLDVVRFAKTKY